MSEELKKSVLNKDIDKDQLDQITGGGVIKAGVCANVSKRDDCQATVEYGSWCGSNDACRIWDCEYDGCTVAAVDQDL